MHIDSSLHTCGVHESSMQTMCIVHLAPYAPLLLYHDRLFLYRSAVCMWVQRSPAVTVLRVLCSEVGAAGGPAGPAAGARLPRRRPRPREPAPLPAPPRRWSRRPRPLHRLQAAEPAPVRPGARAHAHTRAAPPSAPAPLPSYIHLRGPRCSCITPREANVLWLWCTCGCGFVSTAAIVMWPRRARGTRRTSAGKQPYRLRYHLRRLVLQAELQGPA